MRKKIVSLLMTLIILVVSSAVQAHMLWLNAGKEAVKSGKSITVEIGFGHKYPATEGVKEGNIEKVFALDPKGRELPLQRVDSGKYMFVPKSAGEYQVIVKMKKGFLSITPEGRKMASKKEIKDAVSCIQFSMSAITVIRSGSKGRHNTRPADLQLDIIPLEELGELKAGKELPVKLLFNGKPVKGAKLKAADAESSTQKEDAWTQETVTDENGIARIKLASGGQWLISANYETPYPDPNECDKCSYRTSLTFSVR